MSPAPRGGSKGRRGRSAPKKKRRGSGAARIAFAFLVAVAAAATGLAMYFGFVPGPWGARAARTAADVDPTGMAPPSGAPAIDSMVPAAVPTETAAAPPVVASAPGVVTQADSAAGDALYRGAGRCVGCHGAVGEGAATLGPSLRDGEWTSGDGSPAGIARVIAGGAPAGGAYRIAMPAYAGQLAMDDVRRMAAYVYTLSHPGVAVPDSAAGAPSANESVNADTPPSASTPAARGTTQGATAPIARPTVPPPPPPRKP
jgi:mono/diheme cytochrome c family protein